MATRLYLMRDGTPPVTPSSPWGTWNNESFVVYQADPAATAVDDTSAYLTRTVPTGSTASTYVHAIGISPPMQSTHAWGSATAIATWRCFEELSTMNVFQQFYYGIISNDGTILRAISSLEKGATEFPVCSGACDSTDLLSRTRTDAANGMSYTNVPGDRIFFEWGWDKDAAIAGDVGIQYGYSDTAGDLSGDGDAGVQNPWFEVSHTVTFDPEGTSYGSSSKLMLMGVG